MDLLGFNHDVNLVSNLSHFFSLFLHRSLPPVVKLADVHEQAHRLERRHSAAIGPVEQARVPGHGRKVLWVFAAMWKALRPPFEWPATCSLPSTL